MTEILRSLEETPAYEDVTIAYPEKGFALISDLTEGHYLPQRGENYDTERAILCAPSFVKHKENDIEHSAHLALVANVLWEQREELGMYFPDDYDPFVVSLMALGHEASETINGDYNAMAMTKHTQIRKVHEEKHAISVLRRKYPGLSLLLNKSEEYIDQNTVRSRFLHDLDKLVPLAVIIADGGSRWHDFDGTRTEHAYMMSKVRPRMTTGFGLVMIDFYNDYLKDHPELFPWQGELFDGTMYNKCK